MIEKDARQLVEHHHRRLVIQRFARLGARTQSGTVQQLVHFRIRKIAVIDPPIRGGELVVVAIGVNATRPTDLAGGVVTGGLISQQGRDFLGRQFDVDPRLRCHCLYYLHHGQWLG